MKDVERAETAAEVCVCVDGLLRKSRRADLSSLSLAGHRQSVRLPPEHPEVLITRASHPTPRRLLTVAVISGVADDIRTAPGNSCLKHRRCVSRRGENSCLVLAKIDTWLFQGCVLTMLASPSSLPSLPLPPPPLLPPGPTGLAGRRRDW